MEQEPTKTCAKCGAELALGQFHRNCATRDGRHTACRQCRCTYAMMVTDFTYKREQARASYEMKRSWLKARRIAIRVLVDLERRVGGPDCGAVHAGTVDPSVLHTYLPDETTTHLAGLLSSHMGPHVYWSGYGVRWWIGCRDVPAAALRDMRDRVGWVRGLLRPDNIVFRRL